MIISNQLLFEKLEYMGGDIKMDSNCIYFTFEDNFLRAHEIEKIDNENQPEIWTFVKLDRHPDYEKCRKYIISNYARLLNINTIKLVSSFDSNKCNSSGEHWQRALMYFDKNTAKGVKYSLHRLVALAFVYNDDIDNKTDVNHKDGHPTNNKYTNLEWVTMSENMTHAYEHKLVNLPIGEDRYNAIFTNEDVHMVCSLLEQGKKPLAIYLALDGEFSNKNIQYIQVKSLCKHIRHRTHWKHISQNYNIKFSK